MIVSTRPLFCRRRERWNGTKTCWPRLGWTLERFQAAWARNAVAKQILDDQEKLVLQDEGTVKNDQGTVQFDQLQVEYCHIAAPIARAGGSAPGGSWEPCNGGRQQHVKSTRSHHTNTTDYGDLHHSGGQPRWGPGSAS